LGQLIQEKSAAKRSVVVLATADVIARGSTDFFAVADPDVDTALSFIRENLHKSITVDHVARKASLSRRVLELRFQQYLGRTPMEFIRTLRLDRARKQLLNRSEPIGRIARDCGFSNTTHFGVAFRKAYGISPSEFRDRQRRSTGHLLTEGQKRIPSADSAPAQESMDASEIKH
jgi:transcriptional regulator GlxA family with amidase domain